MGDSHLCKDPLFYLQRFIRRLESFILSVSNKINQIKFISNTRLYINQIKVLVNKQITGFCSRHFINVVLVGGKLSL